ncbi:MAG TPA: DUF2249 domain-containing protein [Limnochordia bacterium]
MTAPEPLTLDVRQDLREGKEPFGRIMAAVAQLAPGQSLRLLATFEPIPLLKVLGAKGFSHKARRIGEGDWEVLFTPKGATEGGGSDSAQTGGAAETPAPEDSDAAWPAPVKTLDNRGLLPPEPMVRILEALEHLRPGEVLEVFNDRRPHFLYPELEKRRHAVRTEELEEGVRLLIRCGPRG